MSTDNLVLLLPVILLEVILMGSAVISVLKRKSFKYLNKGIWLLVVIVIQLIGPISYFIIERED